MNVEKVMKMAGYVRTGGKGGVRRKKKAVHKTTTIDTLKRVGVNTIPMIKEVNIFKGNGKPSVEGKNSLAEDEDIAEESADEDIVEEWRSWRFHNHDLCIKPIREPMYHPPLWWETESLHIEDDASPPAILSDEENTKMLFDMLEELEARYL